jgi:hypothetical protein
MTTRTAEISPIIEIPLIVKHVRVVGFLLLLLIPLAIFGQITVSTRVAFGYGCKRRTVEKTCSCVCLM